jgi:carboxylesterase
MKINDVRYMRQGRHLSDLKTDEALLLNPVYQRGKKTDRALLILHGFSSSPAVYRYLLPQIKHYDAIFCPVLPGHAESLKAFAQIKSADWLHASQELCASSMKDYKKVDVLGLSLGGLIACELSKTMPINHLYLLAPALKLHMNISFNLLLLRFFHSLGFVHLRNAGGDFLNEAHKDISYRKLPITTVIEMLSLVQDYKWQAPQCPVDLFLGSHDHVVDSKAVEELFLPVEHARIHWLNNSAHILPLEKELEDIVRCINLK